MHPIPFLPTPETQLLNSESPPGVNISALLETLESANNLERTEYQNAYSHILHPLATKLKQGKFEVEPQLAMVFKRLAEYLLAERQPEYVELIEFINGLPLNHTENQHWRTYYNGVVDSQAGRYEQAQVTFNGLLAAPGLAASVRGRTLNSRSICLRVAGLYEEALNGYRESLAIWQALDDKANAGKALLNMGMTAYYLQNYSGAEAWFSEAAIHFDQAGMIILQGAAQNGLGLVHRDQGQWQEALTCFHSYIRCGEEKDAADVIGTGKLNVAEILLFQGRIAEAIATLQEALGFMERRIHRVDVYLNMGLAYQALGKPKAARVAFQQASDLAYKIERLEILPHVEYRLGLIAQQMGDGKGALRHFEAAVGFIEASRQPMQDEGLKISLLGTWYQIYETLVLYHIDAGSPQQAFIWAERARARAFTEELLKQVPGRDSHENEIEAGEKYIASVAALQNAIPEASTLLAYYTTGVLATDIPMFQAIPKDNALREHLLTPARTLLFLLTPTRFSAIECTIDPNLFSTLSPRGYDMERWLDQAVLTHLSQTLLAAYAQQRGSISGAARAVLGNPTEQVNSVYVIPHGPLHLVPFTALLNMTQPLADEGQPCDSTECVVIYAPSATILQHSLTKTRSTQLHRNSLAVGYNGARDGQHLRHSEAEVLRVAQLLNGKAQIGDAPKKKNLRAVAADYGWLHFACHGWFDHNAPLESYLETGSGEQLLAQEIIDGWNLNAELVTLSACQTGVSRVLRGDEPMGLVRAFLYAGASSVLVSQWPVDDLATYLLMLRFYGLAADDPEEDLGVCLAKAQRWLRTQTATEISALVQEAGFDNVGLDNTARHTFDACPLSAYPYAHPRYWAAFTLVTGG